jgi:[acyl-carrier-protein] S-malonyltransferase
MSAVAVCLFPGQGSQRVGMGADLVCEYPTARRTFEEADQRLGFALSQLCFEGPEDRLQATEHAQPAILTASVAAFRVLVETTGLRPAAMAGHSLGEWSALVAAGALSLGDAVGAARERGRLMQEAVPAGEGAMAAVMGLDPDVVTALCAEASAGDVLSPANLNGAGQVVVAGRAAAVDRLAALATTRRGRVRKLAVSAPFHCALMAPAATGLARVLEHVRFAEPALPVWTSVEARPVRGASELRDLLVRQVTAPVRWDETVHGLMRAGVSLALETGPGSVLSGLLRRAVPGVQAVPAGDVAGIARARELLA